MHLMKALLPNMRMVPLDEVSDPDWVDFDPDDPRSAGAGWISRITSLAFAAAESVEAPDAFSVNRIPIHRYSPCDAAAISRWWNVKFQITSRAPPVPPVRNLISHVTNDEWAGRIRALRL